MEMTRTQTGKMERKTYRKPQVRRIRLKIGNPVLATCTVGGASLSVAGTCGTSSGGCPQV